VKKYLIIVEETDTGYSAYSPDLPGCGSTGKTKKEVERNIQQAIEWFHRQGCRQVVVTLGAEGITVSDSETIDHFPAHKVKALDTTGAGDCFVGWLGAGIAEGLPLRNAAQRAGLAASIKVTRAGAQPGMPYRKEIEELESQ